MASWKRDLARGIVVLGPILVSLYVIYRLYALAAGLAPGLIMNPDALEPLIPGESERAVRTREQVTQFLRVVVTLIVFTSLTLSMGYLMRTTIGDLLERVFDDVANSIPGLRMVYNASKMATKTALGDQESLQEPVKIETWEGLRMTAFKTGRQTEDGQELLFLPTAPNVSSGFVVAVDPDEMTEVDETVEEALTRVLSGGFGDVERHRRIDAGVPIDVVDERNAKTDDE